MIDFCRSACLITGMVLILSSELIAQIPNAQDAPRPLPPSESAKHFQLPPGFQIELIASEPLIREPSGVCWDAAGRLFVCELHGYNLEGQYDIEELNKTGELDRVVRRLQADERHKEAAEKETYGTIKLLQDRNGDGDIDSAKVWADRIPPCLGICPARGGLIAACQNKILFLADRDNDQHAEVREVLFEGFAKGPLERSLNNPQWGPDNWIYIGSGSGGGTINGKYLDKPVQLPRTDFRIKPDGSAIEPIVGSTHTMGLTFTESGDRFVISTRTPGIFVAPFTWQELSKNPYVAFGSLEQNAASDGRSWPTSQPHPWRTRRAEDPGFSKYYSDRYGQAETAPNGFFTSACSPLVYRDSAIPGLNGQLLACEPAQNFVHRALVRRDGVKLTLHRPPGEEMSEFLTSSDPWFHAISLSHAPDGSIYLVDFYREIIEDYSAIPRYLQQQYGFLGGAMHGRIWRLSHQEMLPTPNADMSQLSVDQLAQEVGSPHFWRRQTARRLLTERKMTEAANLVSQHVNENAPTHAITNALFTLDGLRKLDLDLVSIACRHTDPAVRRQGLRFASRWIGSNPELLSLVLNLGTDSHPLVRLQLALTLGDVSNPQALKMLAFLARNHANEPWMDSAILTSVADRSDQLLVELLTSPDTLGEASQLLEPLASVIGNRHDPEELSNTLLVIGQLSQQPALQARCLRGIGKSFREIAPVPLSTPARNIVQQLSLSPESEVRELSVNLIRLMSLETDAERQKRLARAATLLANPQSATEAQLASVYQLATDHSEKSVDTLLSSLESATPVVRRAILDALFSHQELQGSVIKAIETGQIPVQQLNALHRDSLLATKNDLVRKRAEKILKQALTIDAKLFDNYRNALRAERDPANGQKVFRDKCGNCHRLRGIGFDVGPDLNAEFMRAEETILEDVLAPNSKISPGFVTYSAATTSGEILTGLLASESPTSLTLRQADGKVHIVLRNNLQVLRATSVSMMPEDLVKTVSPKDLADVLAWMRRPSNRLMLIDENVEFVDFLNEGTGRAEFITSDHFTGLSSLRITPFQRYSPRIPNWNFPIRENPKEGEFRYLRFAWKSPTGDGVLLELADQGQWPPAGNPVRRYDSGRNVTDWKSTKVNVAPPREWQYVTRDLWKDFGDFTLTGIAPTALGAPVLFDSVELLREKPENE